VEETGYFKLGPGQEDELTAGDVGYFIAGIKTVSDVRVGDTTTGADNPADSPLPGFREVKPVVYSSIYPMDTADYDELKIAMEKLKLNDASLIYDKDSSAALGLRFPLRLPRDAPPGGGPGAPGAGIRPGDHHDGPERALPDYPVQRR
jgi:GTP-binding protein LepA